MKSKYASLLRRPIAFHPVFADIGGSLTAGIMLSQLYYWAEHHGFDKWIFKTQEQWFAETRLTRHEQQSAADKLLKMGLIEIERIGKWRKNHYRIHEKILDKALDAVSRNPVDTTIYVSRNPVDRNPVDRKAVDRNPALVSAGKRLTSPRRYIGTHAESTLKSTSKSKNPPNPLQAGGNGHASLPNPVARDHTEAALAHVATELGITSQRTVRKLLEPLRWYKRHRDTTAYEAADVMIAAWRAYQGEAPLRGIAKPWTIATFFTQGHWMNQRSWPIDQKLRRQAH